MYVIQQCSVSFFVYATRIQGDTQTERHPRWLFADILDRKACHFQMTTSSLSLSLLWSVGQQLGTHAKHNKHKVLLRQKMLDNPFVDREGYRGFSSLPKLRFLVIILIPRPRWCVWLISGLGPCNRAITHVLRTYLYAHDFDQQQQRRSSSTRLYA